MKLETLKKQIRHFLQELVGSSVSLCHVIVLLSLMISSHRFSFFCSILSSNLPVSILTMTTMAKMMSRFFFLTVPHC